MRQPTENMRFNPLDQQIRRNLETDMRGEEDAETDVVLPARQSSVFLEIEKKRIADIHAVRCQLFVPARFKAPTYRSMNAKIYNMQRTGRRWMSILASSFLS